MRDITITVHSMQVPVHETARVVLCSAHADPQRGCHACRKTTVPSMYAGSSGAIKLACDIGLLLLALSLLAFVTCTCFPKVKKIKK